MWFDTYLINFMLRCDRMCFWHINIKIIMWLITHNGVATLVYGTHKFINYDLRLDHISQMHIWNSFQSRQHISQIELSTLGTTSRYVTSWQNSILQYCIRRSENRCSMTTLRENILPAMTTWHLTWKTIIKIWKTKCHGYNFVKLIITSV